MAAGYAKIKEDFDAGHLLSDSQKAQLRSLAAQNFDPNQGSARELSCASVSRLRDARSEEREGRQKVASMRRMLQDARTEAAKVELRERRWAEAAAYRATMNRDKPDLANVVRLNADEVVGMSVRFVQRMAELEPDANKRGWYNLFKHMDDDGSGSPSQKNPNTNPNPDPDPDRDRDPNPNQVRGGTCAEGGRGGSGSGGAARGIAAVSG